MPYKDRGQRRKYHKAYYAKNKYKWPSYQGVYFKKLTVDEAKRRQCVRTIRYRRKREAELWGILIEVKSQPCHDCKQTYPYCVMEFDHTRGTKLFTPCAYSGASFAQIAAEIGKCDVVCANCHRIRTCIRRQQRRRTCPTHP